MKEIRDRAMDLMEFEAVEATVNDLAGVAGVFDLGSIALIKMSEEVYEEDDFQMFEKLNTVCVTNYNDIMVFEVERTSKNANTNELEIKLQIINRISKSELEDKIKSICSEIDKAELTDALLELFEDEFNSDNIVIDYSEVGEDGSVNFSINEKYNENFGISGDIDFKVDDFKLELTSVFVD